MRGALLALILGLWAGGPALAQEMPAPPSAPPAAESSEPATPGTVRSPILTIDPDRFFAGSAFGRRVAAEIQAEAEALAAENRRIEAELTEEERELTERRPDMPVDEFRAAAEAFDRKAQRIRVEQDAKEEALNARLAEEQAVFREAARPIIARLMIERGAAVVIDQRSVIVSFDVIDITDAAIEAMDAQVGDGTGGD